MATHTTDAYLTGEQIETLAQMCRVMGDPTRLGILLACLDQPRSVGEIAEQLGHSSALASHHLRNLKTARLLKAQRRGQRVYYEAADTHVRRFVQDMCDHAREPRSND